MTYAVACTRAHAPLENPSIEASADAAIALDASPLDARAGDARADVDEEEALAPLPPDGPHEIPFAPNRTAYFAAPGRGKDARLITNLHGVCGPPFYSCGKWLDAGTEVGFVVCPTGNARCGDPSTGLASWEASSWGTLVGEMDRSLEAAVAKVAAARPGAFHREGAILTGYSRGGFAVPIIAAMHPGRWPLLVLIEADARVDAVSLRKSGVRAIAFVAGEWGTERVGMAKSVAVLTKAEFPARLFFMPKTGHLYTADMNAVMREVFAFLVDAESQGPTLNK